MFVKDDAQNSCAQCHSVDLKNSHPVGVKPEGLIPLAEFLDAQGRLTCLTCHDVHKEEDPSYSPGDAVSGLLRGHASGRVFCFTCHRDDTGKSSWKHTSAVSYAHMNGRLTQRSSGRMIDEFSIECLSCHDGVISKMSGVTVMSGDYQHGSIGLSHPVGVEYPSNSPRNDFRDPGSLPPQVKLFDHKVGCLSCHDPYARQKNLLVMSNVQSALCLTCHRK